MLLNFTKILHVFGLTTIRQANDKVNTIYAIQANRESNLRKSLSNAEKQCSAYKQELDELVQVERKLKEQKRKNSRLLDKQKKLKEQIVNLQAELHNSTVQKGFVESRVKILSEDLNLLRSELEGLGIKEPEDITKLQARVRELEKTLDLKVKYQMLLDAMLNARMYGFEFAYIESLKPRTVEVLSAKFKKD